MEERLSRDPHMASGLEDGFLLRLVSSFQHSVRRRSVGGGCDAINSESGKSFVDFSHEFGSEVRAEHLRRSSSTDDLLPDEASDSSGGFVGKNAFLRPPREVVSSDHDVFPHSLP